MKAIKTAEDVYNLIRNITEDTTEVLRGKCHVLNISEEEDYDHFTTIRYRVYHSDGYVFDVERSYDSWADNGAGGLVYEVYCNVWDGFQDATPITIQKAYELLAETFPAKLDRYFNWEMEDRKHLLNKHKAK